MRKYALPSATFFAGLLLMFLFQCGQNKTKPPVEKSTQKTIGPAAPKVVGMIKCEPKVYEVAQGDSLWKIAENEWGGRAYFWPVLAEVNKLSDPYTLLIGDLLTIPCLCDLPALTKPVAKKVTPKKPVAQVTKKKPVVVSEKPCGPCESTVAPAPKAVEPPVQAPRSPPAPQVQVQQPAPPAPTPAPPVQVKTPTTTTPAPAPPPAKVAEAKPAPVVVLPPPTPRKLVFVGSAWNSFGQYPIEPGNFANYSHIDQGVVIGSIGKFQAVPYVAFNSVKDTKGYSWNNRVQLEAGLKFVRPFNHGVVEVGGAYAAERRFGATAQTKMGPIGFTNGWFGWNQPTTHKDKKKFLPGTTPGTVQWRVGNISPFERNNLIGVVRVDQGFTLAKVGGVSLIPTGMVQLGFDTDKNPWNNRYTYGGGLKIAIPWKAGVLDFQGGYQCASQYAGAPVASQSRCGPGFSMNIWTGWRKRKGGE